MLLKEFFKIEWFTSNHESNTTGRKLNSISENMYFYAAQINSLDLFTKH